jgi:hypothetical protein
MEMQIMKGDGQMKSKKLALLLVVTMIMSILPVSVAAGVPEIVGVDDGINVSVTTPPAIDPDPPQPPDPPITTTPSGLVTFTYPNFDTRTVNFNSTTNFRVHAQLTNDAAYSDFYVLKYEWLRNGSVWRGEGGSGYEKRGDIINPGFANLGLQLPGGLSHQARGGEWSLRVSLIDKNGNVISVDETHTITVTILGGPAAAPAPTPGPGGTQRPGGGGGSRQPSVNVTVNHNRTTTINVNVTVNSVINQAVRNGKQPKVVINLNNRQTGVVISNTNVQRLIDLRGSIVIVQQNVNVIINYTQMISWNLDSNVEITVNIREITNETDLNNKFNRMRRKPKGSRTPAELRQLFLVQLREVTVTVTTNVVIEQRIEYTLSVNVNNLGLTAGQLSQLTGLFFYLENPNDPYSLVYRVIFGYLDEYGYFHFVVSGDGWFTLILGDPDENANDQNDDNDDQGEDNDNDGQGEDVRVPETTSPTSIRLSIGQTIVVQNGVARQSDAVPFVDVTTGYTMIPLRLVAETMGVTVSWVAETRTAVLISHEVTTTVTIDQAVPGVRGVPTIVNGRTFVTDQFIESVLGASVTVNATTQDIYIDS